MVRIRMQRLGRTHRPFYRIGAMDSRRPRSGKFIEQLGWYDPIAKDESKQLSLKPERIKHWLDHGAQPSDTVRDILGHRDMLPPKMKAAWESEREISRRRVASKPGLKLADEVVESLVKFDSGDVDAAPFKKRISAALRAAKRAVSKGDVDASAKAGSEAQAAKADLDKAIEDSKAKPEEAASE